MTNGDSVTMNTLCNSANGTFVTLDDYHPNTVSVYPKQVFSAVPDTDDPDDAQQESSSEGKRGALKANTFGCHLF